MKKLALLCMIALCVGPVAFATEWQTSGGLNSNWFDLNNWSGGAVPSTEAVEWRFASTTSGGYEPIVINTGTAISGASTCSIWYAGTAQLEVTNGATYNITGGLNLYSSGTNVSNSSFIVNDGATATFTGNGQIGRNFGTGTGLATISVDGASSLLRQTAGYTWLGWGVGGTEGVLLTVTDGALAQFDTVGGLIIQQDGTLVKISVDNGTIKVKGNREGQLGGYKTSGWITGHDGTSATVDIAWNSGDDYTYITSVPEPATISLLGLGLVALIRRNRR